MLENPRNVMGFLKSSSNTFSYFGKVSLSHVTKYMYTHSYMYTHVYTNIWYSQYLNLHGFKIAYRNKSCDKNINCWTEHFKNFQLNLPAQLTLASILV